MPTQSSIRTSLFLRSLAIARLALLSDRKLLCRDASSPSDETAQRALEAQAEQIAKELGELKGCAMKVGQLLSVLGEHFLPSHVNHILKKLQGSAKPLEWSAIESQLKKELGDRLSELSVEEVPLASASIGQVHGATVRDSGEKIVLKIQYPGVDIAVRSDLKALKTLFTFMPGLPRCERTASMASEIEEMLLGELDYQKEAEWSEKYRSLLASDERFVVPRVRPQWTTHRVLAVCRVDGHRLDSEVIQSLPQERRNQIAIALLDLYFQELFRFGFTQSDPHIGNYSIRLNDSNSARRDQIALLDFGAIKTFQSEFIDSYRNLIRATLDGDKVRVITAARNAGFLVSDDPSAVDDSFFDLCRLMVEPFVGPVEAEYDWKHSDLPSRMSQQLQKVVAAREFRAPPRDALFLDKKSTGLYILMGVLGAKTKCADLRALLEDRL